MNTKKLLLFLIVLGVVLILSIPALAATDYKVVLKSSSAEIKPGDTVKVTVSLSNIGVSEGLGAFVGKLTYDNQIFETVTQADIVGATGWGSVLYNPDAGYLAVERAAGDGVKTDTDVMIITLKVKSNANTKDAQVTLSEITCSTGEEDLLAADASAVLSVVQNNSDDNNDNNTDNDNTNSGNTNNGNTNNGNTNNGNTNNGNTNNGNTNNGNTNNGNTNNGNTNSGNTNSGNTNSGNTNSGNTNSGNTNNGNANSGSANNSKNQIKNTANSELPKAGQSNIIATLIVLIILIGAISYINYRKIKNI